MLERTDAITNEILELITFVLAYPTVYEESTIFVWLQNWEIATVSSATKSWGRATTCYLLREREREIKRRNNAGKLQNGVIKAQPTYGRGTHLLTQMEVRALFCLKQFKRKARKYIYYSCHST
jgi:hypothetical protein